MDVEKARELLREISRGGYGQASASRMAGQALRALDGECGEEWEADGSDVRQTTTGMIIADCRDEATARRIARLPKLERAAQAVVDERDDGPLLGNLAPFERAIEALRSALKQEG